MSRRAEHNLWVLAQRSPDCEGQWEAHCLNFDLVAQGDSLPEALECVQEMARELIVDDLKASCDPYARRAPDRYWNLRDLIVKRGETVSSEDMYAAADAGQTFLAALEVVVAVRFEVIQGGRRPAGPPPDGLKWKAAPQAALG